MTSTTVSMPSKTAVSFYLALGVGIFSLSLSAMFVRWAESPGAVTGFYRMFLATILLFPLILSRRRSWENLRKSWPIFPILGGLSLGIDLALWNTSLSYTNVANAALLGNTSPLWVALVAWLILREKLKRNFWFGLLLTLVGAALIMGADFLVHPRLGLGDLMAASSAIFYAANFLFTQGGRQKLDSLTYVWVSGLSGSVSLFIINLAMHNPLTGFNTRTWIVFLAAAIVTQIIGYWAISYSLGRLPASIVTPTLVLNPILTALLAIPLLGEMINLTQVTGGIIALFGIYLVNLAYRRSQVESSTKTVPTSIVG